MLKQLTASNAGGECAYRYADLACSGTTLEAHNLEVVGSNPAPATYVSLAETRL